MYKLGDEITVDGKPARIVGWTEQVDIFSPPSRRYLVEQGGQCRYFMDDEIFAAHTAHTKNYGIHYDG